MLTETDLAILRELAFAQVHGRPMSVSDVARALGVTPSLVSQRMRALEEKHFIESAPRGDKKQRKYVRVRGGVVVQWVSGAAGVAWTWQTTGEVDWDFPLASQVPDERGRDALLRFLRGLRHHAAGNLLDPGTVTDRGRAIDHAGLDVIVFGSAARGDARASSDVDIAVLHGGVSARLLEAIRDAAADVSLRIGVNVQVLLASAEGLEAGRPPGPDWLDDAVRRDGLLVHNGLRGRPVQGPTPTVGWVYWGKGR